MHADEQARTSEGDRPHRVLAKPPAPGRGRSSGLLALQSAAGNAAVVQMLRQRQDGQSAPAAVQRSAVHDVLRTPGRPLDDDTRTDMEARLGADFTGVRIHDDQDARTSAADVGARAYTSGDHVVIGEGGSGKHTLAHELTHVIQQRQGPVAGTDRGDNLRVSDPADRFEREAEANAVRAMSVPVPVQRTATPAASTAHQASTIVARMPAAGADTETPAGAGAAPWLVFGVDGRSKEQLTSAVDAGYRRFDTAESYGNTATVAQVLGGLPRSEYEVIYKFDVRPSESAPELRARLERAAALFGGRLDALIIHNLDAGHSALTDAWQVLGGLKSAGTARQIGLGNIGENHAGLLAELGGVDVVENSVESVLLSQTVEEAIKASGAHLYYYDVIRTARQMQLDLTTPDDLKALIYTMSVTFHRADDTSNATMISSSGSPGTQAANRENFGPGPDHVEFTGGDQYVTLGKIHEWRNEQSACQENDTAFELSPELAGWLAGLCEGGTAGTVRSGIEEAAKKEGCPVDAEFIGKWLVSQGHVESVDLTSVKVPSRVGLNKRYLGMPLQKTLAALFGVKNCDWKWSFQLVQLMFSSAEAWDGFLRAGADEIARA
jgi:hypothetical protein